MYQCILCDELFPDTAGSWQQVCSSGSRLMSIINRRCHIFQLYQGQPVHYEPPVARDPYALPDADFFKMLEEN